MKIIDHGKWIPYKPAKDRWPEGAPTQALFCKRESDGVDWYDYVNPPKNNRRRLFSENFREDSVKVAFMFHEMEQKWIIGPSVIDATLIFPANHHVREFIGFGSVDEDEIIAAFRNKVIDPDTNALSERPVLEKIDWLAVVIDLKSRVEKLEEQLKERG
jgi:hypothetical protein